MGMKNYRTPGVDVSGPAEAHYFRSVKAPHFTWVCKVVWAYITGSVMEFSVAVRTSPEKPPTVQYVYLRKLPYLTGVQWVTEGSRTHFKEIKD